MGSVYCLLEVTLDIVPPLLVVSLKLLARFRRIIFARRSSPSSWSEFGRHPSMVVVLQTQQKTSILFLPAFIKEKKEAFQLFSFLKCFFTKKRSGGGVYETKAFISSNCHYTSLFPLLLMSFLDPPRQLRLRPLQSGTALPVLPLTSLRDKTEEKFSPNNSLKLNTNNKYIILILSFL